MTRYLLLFDSYGLVFVGRPLWREDGSVFCVCYWPSPAQSFSGPSPLDLATTFYSHSFETSLFVASYDSQGHGAGIRPRLHTGMSVYFSFFVWERVKCAPNCVSLSLFLLVISFQILHKREIYVLLLFLVAVSSRIEPILHRLRAVTVRYAINSCIVRVYKIMSKCQRILVKYVVFVWRRLKSYCLSFVKTKISPKEWCLCHQVWK
jgi:hypothetical protein